MTQDYGDLLARALAVVEAAARLPPGERVAYVHDACGDQPELLKAGLGLLGRMSDPDVDFTGRTIDDYVVHAIIGEGEASKVYAAARRDPPARVAIKFLRPGSRSGGAMRRFRRERLILSTLEHEHIVRFLGHGETSEGWPYLVMPLVEGLDIVSHCNQRRQAPLRERLELFLQLVSAVEYAHSGFIHQDLKPANVLVTSAGQVRVLDFGIAKPKFVGYLDGFGADDATARPYTEEYASPEQLRKEDVTTATDIYQLGLILFELLAGRLPFEREGQSREARRQAVRFDAPPRPSEVATEDAARHARLRSASDLRRRLRGDLDAIVLTALRTRPDDRYRSATAFGDDVRRYLQGEAVTARRGGWAYRAGKVLRRHWLPFLLVAALVGALGGALLVQRQLNQRRAAEVVLIDATRSALEGQNAALSARNARLGAAADRLNAQLRDQLDEALARRQLEFAELYERFALELDPGRMPGTRRAGLGGEGERLLVTYRRELLSVAMTLRTRARDNEGSSRLATELERLERPRGGPAIALPVPEPTADVLLPLARTQAALIDLQLAGGQTDAARQTADRVLRVLAPYESAQPAVRELAAAIRTQVASTP